MDPRPLKPMVGCCLRRRTLGEKQVQGEGREHSCGHAKVRYLGNTQVEVPCRQQ